MDERFPANRFKSNKMINHATMHISEQFVGFKVQDKSLVDNLFHGFIDATCRCNSTIISTITRL